MGSRFRGHFLVLIGALLWSTGGVCVKLLEGYGPIAISAGRSIVSALFFLFLLKGRIAIPRATRTWIFAGAIVYAAVVMSFVTATRFTTAANAIILQYTAPLWIAFLGWMVLREVPTRRELLAMIVGGGGVGLCASGGLTLFARDHLVSQALLGDAIALFSGLCFALITVILRVTSQRAPASGGLGAPPSLVCLFYGNVLAALLGLPAFLSQIPHAGIPSQPVALGWGLLVWLGIGQLGLGYWFFQRGLQTTRALTASLLGLIEPAANPIWVAILVGEIPPMATRMGAVFVLVSVVLSLTARRRVAPPSPDPPASQ